MSKRIQIKVFGRVQGVFFRESAKEEAEKLGLVGWVKNESDGTVLVDVEGHDEDVEEFIGWCQTGPDAAEVEKVETQNLPAQNKDEEFCVIY